ncbi:hypothetical protein GCM10010869_30450 [Mesorhizobium tianshanense]|uniref:Uncharacterized protein n=1 Tax=Mesorhizobium tianshanense TaxID=39844 RepID=A0A562MV19_9HYPH|nr:hypothetical protein [Mesorhizobium tianshanense]TWI23739.1 hypothetical protein IQ26_06401 [Mesorhizobium tianshanense]GLS37452.1 hypothetical protein GCM10010869_30450 [Mesorhizobium tianshanense]
MKPSNRKLAIISATGAVAVLSVVALVLPIGVASSQQPPMMDHTMPGHGQMQGMMQQRHQEMMQMHGQGTMQMAMGTPTMPGQDAFGAIQEIVRMLEADPETDWSKIDLEALRQHLIDMNEVTLKADAAATPIEGGLEITVTGEGRTFAAIQRMVPAHAEELNQMNGWSAKTEALPDGVRLTVTSNSTREVAHIRGLGFIGLLVSGSHHQPHHLAMAKKEMPHQH